MFGLHEPTGVRPPAWSSAAVGPGRELENKFEITIPSSETIPNRIDDAAGMDV